LGALPALAETASGWVTYISQDGSQLMLNSRDMYEVTCKCAQKVSINDHVQLVWELQGTRRSISSIDKISP
jgi:hypothetical protein